MREAIYRGRRAAQAENDRIRVTVTLEGGHVAEILHKASGVNPLWTPHWPSIEPSTYDPAKHPEYGANAESRLLAGIMGHSLCLDTFGCPSAEEVAAGMPVHGEAPTVPYGVESSPTSVVVRTTLPRAQLLFERHVRLSPNGMLVRFSEHLENLSPTDRPIAWTQHVTLGPPFLERGVTQFRVPATKSKVIDESFNDGRGPQRAGAEFDWPYCPRKDGGMIDLRVFSSEAFSGGFTTHLLDASREHAWFLSWSPKSRILFGYAWKCADFPWLGRWEENHLRTAQPWNGQGLACGMEFGVSPLLESRRQMVARGSLFNVPSFRWIPAKTRLAADYCAFITTRESIPESLTWNGDDSVTFG